MKKSLRAITFTLDSESIDIIEKIANENKVSRSGGLRILIARWEAR